MSLVPATGVRTALPVLLLAAAVLIGAGGSSVYYHAREAESAKLIADDQARTTAALNDARGQIQSLSARLDSIAASSAVSPAAESAPPVIRRQPAQVVRVPQRRRVVGVRQKDDPRFKQLQSQLSDQHKELIETRDNLQSRLDSQRDDLQGRLDTTRDELGGSIARNHDELVLLQKRGERNYHEFTLTKSKEFRPIGPVSLSLRKADTKHQNFNVAMIVADSHMEKKHINLFEPVMISLNDRPQPVELVVNQITKDEIRGYVSEPKYKRSELAEAAVEQTDKPQQLVVR
jgi:hypothetical protein